MMYYTYAFLREDGTPYYIGKGKGNRMYVKSRRGVKPPKDTSRILKLKDNLTEAEAFAHEIYMIAIHPNLKNLTEGGEGVSGYRHTEDTKQQMSSSRIGNQNAKGSKGQVGMKHPEWRVEKNRQGHLGQKAWNKGRTMRPQTVSEKKAKSDANWDGIVRWFKSPEGEIHKVDYPLSQFCAKMDLTATNLSSVWRERPNYKSHKGWTKHFITETDDQAN